MERSIVIAGYKRSPFHFAAKGALAKVRPDELAAAVIRALVEESGVDPADIEDVILGNAMPEGEQGMNMGRYAVFLAGLPVTTAGTTVNKWCGSSMQAIHNAAGMLSAGAGAAYVAAGVESMTRVPMGGFNPAPNPGLMARWPETYHSMGQTAETVAERYQVTRERQQEFAVASHRKAAQARADGRFADEIVPVETPGGGTVGEDGGIRPDTSVEALDGLKPAFLKDGTVTAGTSSPLTDGAAATLICTADYADRNGLPVLARIRAIATTGLEPEVMGMGPVEATRKALDRAGLAVADIDIFELNEAFASQALACIHELGLDPDTVNRDGGAIAIGHPLGASGARITGKAASVLKREGGRYAVAAMCIGGGQGIATVLEAV
ncbi:MAG: thiolase family protein [Rhodospirillaceae bacterium]|nr:thiolase family protein [Rhodospirillaceae bacterium]MYB14029.1 thiolase family protein [Rhodospirillaceae bacterium]MYI47833.1 thiolase family protein [Rhodospirillaceae bacterium]